MESGGCFIIVWVDVSLDGGYTIYNYIGVWLNRLGG